MISRAVSSWVLRVQRGVFGPDAGARVGITDKPAQVKSGKGSLYHIYNVAPKTISLLAMERRLDLSAWSRFAFRSSAMPRPF
jgi:hypothetical protein